MKLKSFFSIAAAGLLLASCSNSEGGNSADSLSNASKADSLIYCFGQMRGAEYQREAANDTTLDSKEAKQEYLRGVRAGIQAVKAEQEAYNRGLFLGMQMAMNMNQFKEDYNIQLSSKVFLESLSEALNCDSAVNTTKMQSDFYRLMGEFNKEKETRDKEAAETALKEAAASKKMEKITDDLYGSVAKSDKEKIKKGDKVKLDLTITNPQGKEIDAPFPKELTIGQRMANTPLNDAVTSLASGEKGSFVTTAQALFGNRCAQMGLKPADVLTLTITPTVAEPAAEKAE